MPAIQRLAPETLEQIVEQLHFSETKDGDRHSTVLGYSLSDVSMILRVDRRWGAAAGAVLARIVVHQDADGFTAWAAQVACGTVKAERVRWLALPLVSFAASGELAAANAILAIIIGRCDQLAVLETSVFRGAVGKRLADSLAGLSHLRVAAFRLLHSSAAPPSGDDTLTRCIDAVAASGRLQALDVAGRGFDGDGVRAGSDLLRLAASSALVELSLSDIAGSVDLVAAYAQSLEQLKMLELDLPEPDTGRQHIAPLRVLLAGVGPRLTYLRVWWNADDSDGVFGSAGELDFITESCPRLRVLHVNDARLFAMDRLIRLEHLIAAYVGLHDDDDDMGRFAVRLFELMSMRRLQYLELPPDVSEQDATWQSLRVRDAT